MMDNLSFVSATYLSVSYNLCECIGFVLGRLSIYVSDGKLDSLVITELHASNSVHEWG